MPQDPETALHDPPRHEPSRRRRGRTFFRVALLVSLVIAFSAAAAAFWGYRRLEASLPMLDGRAALPGLSAPVTVTRDALGIPTIEGRTRPDVARALGYLHAQERFFQMDLARRRAAGELAELVGGRAVEVDREIRVHRFRDEAKRARMLMSEPDARVLAAYTEGVNTGLTALASPPFEYLVLRQSPRPWTQEDSLLVVLSMFITLQDSDGAYESTLATMHDVLPEAMASFLVPRGTEWDAPPVGASFSVPAIPGPDVYNLRAKRQGRPSPELPRPRSTVDATRVDSLAPLLARRGSADDEASIGSNSWVVSGAHTEDGRPWVANDMHLAIRVPNIWYRAVMTWPDTAEGGDAHTLVGVTLPGVPALVVGSNTHVAWGFTNTYADWSDIVLLDVDPAKPGQYLTPDGWKPFDVHEEVIRVRGEPDQRVAVQWTIWGPVIRPSYTGRPRALRWAAHDADRLATSVAPLENARTVSEAFDAANGLGVPGQNMVVADTRGTIGWTIFGAIPRRLGMDGRLPVSWADGLRGWDEWLAPADYPRIVNPPSGRIWTANARVVDGAMLQKLGDGSYEVGSRASIIRNRLQARDRFSKNDLLAIQLDASADFLARWRELLLRTLDTAALANHPERVELRDILLNEWSGRADPESVAYRMTRVFREATSERVIRFVLADCYEKDAFFDYTTVRRREGPIWRMVTEKPMHLLDPAFASWEELLLSAVDAAIADSPADASSELRSRVWSEYNPASFRHPLSASLPFAGRWLDMPEKPLPGDLFTPRMHWGINAASERLIVSPGRESDSILHMPGGQSGHPLSPFYSNSHDAWLYGEPTPLLPGETTHRLELVPAS